MNVSTPAQAARPAGPRPHPRIRDHLRPALGRRRRERREGPGPRLRCRRARARQARQGRGLGPPQAGVPGRQAAQGRLRLRQVRRRRGPRRRGRAQPQAPGRGHEVHDRPDEDEVDIAALQIDPEETKLGKLDCRPSRSPRSRARSSSASSTSARTAAAACAAAPDEGEEYADEDPRRRRRAERAGARRAPASPKTRRRAELSHGDDGRRQGHQPRSGSQRRDRPAPRWQKAHLPVLHRQGAGHRLQGPAGAQVLHHRAREDRPAPHQRQLRAASAQGAARGQAGAQHRAPALHRHA